MNGVQSYHYWIFHHDSWTSTPTGNNGRVAHFMHRCKKKSIFIKKKLNMDGNQSSRKFFLSSFSFSKNSDFQSSVFEPETEQRWGYYCRAGRNRISCHSPWFPDYSSAQHHSSDIKTPGDINRFRIEVGSFDSGTTWIWAMDALPFTLATKWEAMRWK